jgi:TolA-binding protein
MLDDGVKRIAAGGELTLSNEPTNETRDVAPAPAPSPRSARTSPHATPGMLLAQADSARLAGDLKAARRALQTLLSQYPSDPRLDLARFQLAVIKEQEGANPRQVVDAFERACARVQGSSLRQDCYFRWYQAEVRAGMTLAARQTAERALREFPEGRYSSRLRRQLAGQDSAP